MRGLEAVFEFKDCLCLYILMQPNLLTLWYRLMMLSLMIMLSSCVQVPTPSPEGQLPSTTIPASTPEGSVSSDDPVLQTPPAAQGTGQVIGTVTYPDGTPAVEVAIFVVQGTGEFSEMAIFTNAEGIYRWVLPTGDYVLQAAKDGYQIANGNVSIRTGETRTLDFQLTISP
jgi:hypothetical protein